MNADKKSDILKAYCYGVYRDIVIAHDQGVSDEEILRGWSIDQEELDLVISLSGEGEEENTHAR